MRLSGIDANLAVALDARSSDGGATIAPNVRASDADFDPTYYSIGGEYRVGIASSDRTVHAIWTDARNGDNDVFGASVDLDFHTDVSELSAATGGTVAFSVQAGPLYQGDADWILGSASGTAPGIDLDFVQLPLNYDAFMLWTIVDANSSTLPGFTGNLGATGAASASLVSGPLPPALVGFQMDFAALIKSGPAFRWASNATHLAIGN